MAQEEWIDQTMKQINILKWEGGGGGGGKKIPLDKATPKTLS